MESRLGTDNLMSSFVNFVDRANEGVAGRSPSILPLAEDILRLPSAVDMFPHRTGGRRVEMSQVPSESLGLDASSSLSLSKRVHIAMPAQRLISSAWTSRMAVSAVTVSAAVLFLLLLMKLVADYKAEPEAISSANMKSLVADSLFERKFEWGNLSEDWGENSQAVICYNQASECSRVDKRDRDRLLQAMQRMVRKSPRDSLAWLGLGKFYEARGNLKEAAATYQEALRAFSKGDTTRDLFNEALKRVEARY